MATKDFNDLKFIRTERLLDDVLHDGSQYLSKMAEILFNKFDHATVNTFGTALLSALESQNICCEMKEQMVNPSLVTKVYQFWKERQGEEVTWVDLIKAFRDPQFKGRLERFCGELKQTLEEDDDEIKLEDKITDVKFLAYIPNDIPFEDMDDVKFFGNALGLKDYKISSIISNTRSKQKTANAIAMEMVTLWYQKFPNGTMFDIVKCMILASLPKKDILDFASFWRDEKKFRDKMADTTKPILPVVLQTVTHQQIKDLLKEAYPMKRQPRGRAVIINNMQFSFDKSLFREGSDADVNNLKNLFKALDFDVDLFEDCTANDIRDIVDKETDLDKKEALSQADAFILVVMSHGKLGEVQGSDGLFVEIEADIMTPFDGAHCESLRGKPKVFIIQACQGDRMSLGFTPPKEGNKACGTSSQADGGGDGKAAEAATLYTREQAEVADDGSDLVPAQREPLPLHEKADMLRAQATVGGYKAWRDPKLGSRYIRTLVQTISQEADSRHLVEILESVNKKLKEHQEACLQMSEYRSTLSAPLYFFPGYSG